MTNANLESSIVRAVWSAVEMINKQALLHLNDADIVQQIIEQVEPVLNLNIQQRQSLVNYVSSKVLLMKDIAEF